MDMLQPRTPWAVSPPPVPVPSHAKHTSAQATRYAALDHADLLSSLINAIDGLALGLAVFEQSGRSLYANAAAAIALQRVGWARSADGWQSNDAQLRGRWADALHEVCNRSRRLLLELPSDDDIAFVGLSPVQCARQTLAFATFGRGAVCGALELQLFATRRGLTGAENRVLSKIAQGLKPVDIAQRHGVALSTVLAQVAAIRGKTGVSRVPDLLRQLSRLPPAQAVLNVE